MRLQPGAVDFSLVTVAPGAEKDVVRDLKRADDPGRAAAYFMCFGSYDILRVGALYGRDEYVAAPRVADVSNVATMTGLAAKTGWPVGRTVDRLRGAAGGVLALLKPNPKAMAHVPAEAEETLLRILPELARAYSKLEPRWDVQVDCFLGLGYYEIIMFVRSANIEKALRFVTFLRTMSLSGLAGPDEPAFVDTLSIPVVEFNGAARQVASLEGTVLPEVSLWCQPTKEATIEDVAKELLPGMTVLNAYGAADLCLNWDKSCDAAVFTREIVKARRLLADKGLLKSVTSLRVTRRKEPEIRLEGISRAKGLESTASEAWDQLPWSAIASLAANGSRVSPRLLQTAQGFLSRIRHQLKSAAGRSAVADMYPFVFFMLSVAGEMSRLTESERTIARAEDDLATFLELGFAGLAQRTAETGYPELTPWDAGTEGVLRSIHAASTVPEFLFEAIGSSPSTPHQWAGFVAFGPGHHTMSDGGEVIVLPEAAVLRPETWMAMTHEVWHAHFRRLDRSPQDAEWIEGLITDAVIASGIAGANVQAYDFIDEMYAHWADFVYCYDSDIDEYLSAIWRSWLHVWRVHRYPGEYLTRSFLVWLQHRGLHEPLSQREIQLEYEDFEGRLLELVPELEDCAASIEPNEKASMLRWMQRTQGICGVFAAKLWSSELHEAATREYPEAAEHLRQMLDEGEIVDAPIGNPVVLLRLLDEAAHVRGSLDLRQKAAIVMSLSRQHLRSVAPGT